MVKVRDDGDGIPTEALGRVFDAFAQGDNASGRWTRRPGIGPLPVKRLVELHGGTVEAVSDKSRRGTEMVIRVADDRSACAAPDIAPTQIVGTLRRGNVGRRILLVEDNSDAASTMATLLEHDRPHRAGGS